jgi:hypothetical protein
VFTGIDSILALGNVKNDVIWEMSGKAHAPHVPEPVQVFQLFRSFMGAGKRPRSGSSMAPPAFTGEKSSGFAMVKIRVRGL